MKTNTPIHLVKQKDYDVLNHVYAVFDTKEKATKFVDMFKNRSDIEIIDGILNPDYGVEHRISPYYISLAQTGSMPRDMFICDYNMYAENRHEEYNISFYGSTKSSRGLFILKISAIDQKEALKRAINIRNAAIRNGEWELAWEMYKLQQSKLHFNPAILPIR